MVPICIPLIMGEGEYLYTDFSHIYFPISVVLHCGCPLELLCVHMCAYMSSNWDLFNFKRFAGDSNAQPTV